MSLLEQILDSTAERIAAAKREAPLGELEQRCAETPIRPFAASLTRPGVAVIAEMKRRSPSAGDLAAGADAAQVARDYERGGAAAVSVLTEPHFFGGSLEDLGAARGAGLPVLRKDFVIDPYQVTEARAHGADALLLIVRACREALPDLLGSTGSAGMDALVEVFDEDEAEAATSAGARLVGINNRDLATFEVDRGRTLRVAKALDPDVTVVALSGVSTRAEVEELKAAGIDAVLVGEAAITAPDRAAKVRELAG